MIPMEKKEWLGMELCRSNDTKLIQDFWHSISMKGYDLYGIDQKKK